MGKGTSDMGCGASTDPKEEPAQGEAAPAAAAAEAAPAEGEKGCTKKAGESGSGRKQVFLDAILSDTSQRVWVEKLPDCFLEKIKRPYTDEEIAAAKVTCNVDAAPAEGRGPKLIFQLGAAGTGKSTRMEDCYTTMDLKKETIVVADGDIVREAHTGLMAAFQLNKKTLIDGMTAAGSPELEQYTKELAEYADDKPIGFKDSEKWSYNDSGKYKDQFANDALDNKKDVVLGITNGTHLTKKYKKVIDNAIAGGSTIAGMATFVRPEVLVDRQVGRGKRKGRLVQTNKNVTSGCLVENAVFKQALAIKALPQFSAMVKEHKGTLMLFDNTPDYFADPASKQGPFWVQKGDEITVTYDGPATVEGLMAHIKATIQAEGTETEPAK